MDRRGFGQTRTDTALPHAWTEDLRAVLDALGLSEVELIGCSMGGRIAIDFALAWPERVAGLTLVAPSVTGVPAPVLDAASRELSEAIEAADAAGRLDEVNRLQARLWLDGPGQPEGRVGGAARALFLAMNDIALRSPSVGEALPAPDAWPRLEVLAMPVRLVCGALDLPHLVHRCKQMAERIPGTRHWVLPGTAHLPSLEAPETFNRVLKDAGLL